MMTNIDSEPLVSICIPTYNSVNTIRETLDSVVNQTYKNLEIIVVDNASTDSTVDEVQRFSDSRLTLHINEINLGGEGNFNRCIELAQGDLIAIYHADDIYNVDMVSKQVEMFRQNPEVGAVFTLAERIDDTGKAVGYDTLPESLGKTKSNTYNFKEIFSSVITAYNFMICPSCMARRDVYKDEIREWDNSKYRSSADLDVWLRILSKHPIAIIPESLMYRRVTSSYSAGYNHLRTEPADFFLVTEDYLRRDDISKIITADDLRRYRFIKFNDNYQRAISFTIKGDRLAARKLLKEISDKDLIRASLTGISRFRVFLSGLILYILSFINIGSQGRDFLYRWKFGGDQ
jgi:glycosyltransferase involved in cell wall biosynthesis